MEAAETVLPHLGQVLANVSYGGEKLGVIFNQYAAVILFNEPEAILAARNHGNPHQIGRAHV